MKNRPKEIVCQSKKGDLFQEHECEHMSVVEEDEEQLHVILLDDDFQNGTHEKSKDGEALDKNEKQDNATEVTRTKRLQNGNPTRECETTHQKISATKSDPKVVWVSNVAHNTSASELQDALSAHGNVIGAKVVVNARYPGSSCYGYVTMASSEDVDNVIAKINNTELNGQIIKVGRQFNDTSKGVPSTRSEDPGKNQGNKDSSEKSVHPYRSLERSRSMGKGGSREGSSHSEHFRGRHSRSPSRKGGILTFAQIKEERERQKLREKERVLREEFRCRQEELARQKEVDRRQRQEAVRLEREKEKLRIEKEKIAKEKAELMKLGRERHKISSERIELEKRCRLEQVPTPSRFNHSSGKSKPHASREYSTKGSRYYPGRFSSSKYDTRPHDRRDRLHSSSRPEEGYGYRESRENEMSHNESQHGLPYQCPTRPTWNATSNKSDWRPNATNRWMPGNPQQLRPYSVIASNFNSQCPPPPPGISSYNQNRFD